LPVKRIACLCFGEILSTFNSCQGMKKINRLMLILSLLIPLLTAAQNNEPSSLVQSLKNHLAILASDSLEGRGLGTDGRIKARTYIENHFKKAGLLTYDDDYFQNFEMRFYLINLIGTNVIGYLPGNDPELKNEFIVIGAHYDHLGYYLENNEKVVFNGADDNASGVATLLELVRYFCANPYLTGRSLLFIAFDAEESGLIGSKHFVSENIKFEMKSLKAMFSLDMVGMYSANQGLSLHGIAAIRGGKELASAIAEKQKIILQNTTGRITSGTDTKPFGDAGIPAVHAFTGLKSPYHKPEDDYDLLDYEGMAKISLYLRELITQMSLLPEIQPAFPVKNEKKKQPVKFNWGVIAHAGSSHNIYPDEFFRAKNVFAGSAGLFMQLQTPGSFYLQPELLYDYNGSKSENGTFRRHTLTIPLNIQYNLAKATKGQYRIYPFAGVYYRYTFLGENDFDGLNYADVFETQEWGLNLGFGMNVMGLHLAWTWRRGITNIYRNTGANIFNSGSYFTVGYRF